MGDTSLIGNYTAGDNTPGVLPWAKEHRLLHGLLLRHIVYGTAIDAVQLNAEVNEAVLQDDEGNSQGTFAYTVGGADAAGQILEVGTHTIAVAYTPAEEDTNAYIGATDTVEITVTQAPLTVTIANIEHTYGDPLPRIDAADATRLNIAGWIGDDGIEAFLPANGGRQPVVAISPC